MKLLTQDFPIVRLLFEPGSPTDIPTVMGQMDGLLDREESFVYVSSDAPGPSDKGDPALRRELALWMKRNKARIVARTKAQIMVTNKAEEREALQAMAPLFEKAWCYPLLLAGSDAEAHALAKTLLV